MGFLVSGIVQVGLGGVTCPGPWRARPGIVHSPYPKLTFITEQLASQVRVQVYALPRLLQGLGPCSHLPFRSLLTRTTTMQQESSTRASPTTGPVHLSTSEAPKSFCGLDSPSGSIVRHLCMQSAPEHLNTVLEEITDVSRTSSRGSLPALPDRSTWLTTAKLLNQPSS